MRRIPSLQIVSIFVGDVLALYFSLWTMLAMRYLELPSMDLYLSHALPFSYLFVVWVIVYYIDSMYEPHTVVLKSRIPAKILNVQTVNSIIAVLFFYFIPAFGITPKANLFLYLFVSFIFVSAWRILGVQFLGLRKKEHAVLIGSGEETRKLYRVVNDNPLYPMRFITWLDLDKLSGIDFEDEILARIYSEEISLVVIDMKNEKVAPILPKLYNLIFSHVRFIEQYRVYEDIFDRIPLSLIGYNWFLENVSSRAHFGYDLFKRVMDITLALLLLLPALLVTPFIIIGTIFAQPGKIFFTQARIGRGNREFLLYKFRTMTMEQNILDRRVTPYGAFLRKSRLDELPQLLNVLKGELSLIGPRPEIPKLAGEYAKVIPYYNMRHLITPGLSGWAQVHHDNHPHFAVADVTETKVKLAYDLYYLKNRSLALDIKIALKTLKTLVSRSGL
jgi:lipopolysaccharide/colanic/teichoic acid biosynthesis glycosyltransferase